jgi:two-component system sensor histidine kinase NblS
VLDLSRLDSDQEWQLEPVEVEVEVEQTLRTYRLNAQEKGVAMELESEAQLPRVRGNWDLLLQVFDNLVGNGLKFTPPGGQLTLRASPWPHHCALDPSNGPEDAPSCPLSSPLPKVHIEITDTGAGISEMDQEQIFERFYRVENAVHTAVGTGLGLSIVRDIFGEARLHGADGECAGGGHHLLV